MDTEQAERRVTQCASRPIRYSALMTLNVLFTSRHIAYASGDFRLTYGGGRFADDLNTQKIIPVCKFDWCALVTFCGLAKTSAGVDVGDWIVDQAKLGVARDSLADFVGRLRSGERWISKLRGPKGITISIVGFLGRKPFLVCLSNFQHIDGTYFKQIEPNLQKFDLRPKLPEVRVFGDRGAVTELERIELTGRLSKLPEDLEVVADVNRVASSRSKLISEPCVVGAIMPTGEGWICPFGIDPESEYMPNFVLRGSSQPLPLKPKVDANGNPLKMGWVQSACKTHPLNGMPVCAVTHEIRNADGPPAAGPAQPGG